ncbi:uncharacterized protein LOC111255481 [Varroa destructor]|uniref:Secreted protein n=1 Tax=Varroa destructor TaxID=109461 RepID=A0A7M7KWV8_VARDE|nr:uncharacterized protein LOC111255481 [Varroa destructor]
MATATPILPLAFLALCSFTFINITDNRHCETEKARAEHRYPSTGYIRLRLLLPSQRLFVPATTTVAYMGKHQHGGSSAGSLHSLRFLVTVTTMIGIDATAAVEESQPERIRC